MLSSSFAGNDGSDDLGHLPDPDAIEGLGLPVVEPEGEGGRSAALAGGSAVTVAGDPKKGKEKDKPSPQPAFLLGEGLPPVPPKLVDKIQRLEFVDMAELLGDNLEVQRRSSDQEPQPLSQSSRNRRREVPDILSWVSCFGVYAAVLAAKHPNMVRQLFAYQTMVVQEARRCAGNGWQAYDCYFRQQVAGNPAADWSRLNTALYAVTFLSQGNKNGTNCSLCMGSDHTSQECAITLHQPRPMLPAKRTLSGSSELGGVDKDKRRATTPCCFAWNQGECRYPRCKFRHTCLHCSGDHPMTKCGSMQHGQEGKSHRDPKATR